MNNLIMVTSLACGLVGFGVANAAQAPSSAPVGATGECKDGTFWTNPTKQGACSGHKGIKAWYVGPGVVWVDGTSHIYHCSTDRWYGKTKTGSYMTEASAIAAGNRADHGNPCH